MTDNTDGHLRGRRSTSTLVRTGQILPNPNPHMSMFILFRGAGTPAQKTHLWCIRKLSKFRAGNTCGGEEKEYEPTRWQSKENVGECSLVKLSKVSRDDAGHYVGLRRRSRLVQGTV